MLTSTEKFIFSKSTIERETDLEKRHTPAANMISLDGRFVIVLVTGHHGDCRELVPARPHCDCRQEGVLLCQWGRCAERSKGLCLGKVLFLSLQCGSEAN